MAVQEKIIKTPTGDKIRRSTLVIVVTDVVLIAALVICLLTYTSRNNIDSYNQNVDNIQSIAVAESKTMRVALDNTGAEVESAYRYLSGKTLEEALDYLSLISANSSEGEYQLLKRDETLSTELYHVYDGFSTKKENGQYLAVCYEDTSLSNSIHEYSSHENGEVSFSQNFTNKTDALRYFAVFTKLPIIENGHVQTYYLVRPQKEDKVLEQLQFYSQYQEIGIAVCYTDGKYLARDNGFRSDNFYDYLYKYNDLSLDERNAIKAAVQADSDGTGTLTYKDFKGRESIFAYAECSDFEDWLVVISVPQTEFVAGQLLTFFPLIIIIFLVVLLAFNIWRLLDIVKELRMSVERERIANASKSSFLSRMSHEIRTPLNAVIGYNNIARNGMADAKTDAERKQAEMKVMDCLAKSEIASKHLLSIINDVLDMSAIESGKIKIASDRFDFKGLITSLSTVFYSQARDKGITFNVMFDSPAEDWLVGDSMRTNQILTNLLSNAIKFTPEGGFVTLRICRPDPDNASHLRFEVSDTGIGMTKEYLSHIWTPFEQADSSISRRFGGTGLGLSITKNLVDLMHGTIGIESTPGEGSLFRVDLPFEAAEPPKTGKVYDFSAIDALVVDDDMGTCNYVKLLMNNCGAKCTVATSGREAVSAVAAAKSRKESYSLCLVDWQMPGMDGIETIRRIREITGDKTPIAVLTAYDYTDIADTAMKAGANRFLSKPLFQSTLFDLLVNISGTKTKKAFEGRKDKKFTGARVLLAEDNRMNMEIAKNILQSAGMLVDSAWNGREAVEIFEAAPEKTYAAILMDVHMPEMNGHDATRAIRASAHPGAKTIPIIAMTADAFAENVAEALAAGMNDHIAKPVDVPTLFHTLEKYIM